MSKGKSSFVLYHDIRGPLELLTDEQRGKLFLALLDYSEFGSLPDFSGSLQMAFAFIRTALDRDAEAWNDKREKRREAGSMGGKQKAANVANVAFATFATQGQAGVANVAVPVPAPAPVPAPVPDNNPPVPTAHARENPDLGRVMSFFLDRINPAPSPTCIDLLKQYTASLSADVVLHALEIAIDERKTAWSYIQAILSQYERDGVRDMDGVKRREQERQQRRESAAPPARRMSKTEEFVNAGRNHERTAAEMNKMLADLDKI